MKTQTSDSMLLCWHKQREQTCLEGKPQVISKIFFFLFVIFQIKVFLYWSYKMQDLKQLILTEVVKPLCEMEIFRKSNRFL